MKGTVATCARSGYGSSCSSRDRTTHVVDPLPERVRLVAAPGELRGLESEVLGWQHRDGVTSVICRLVDGAPGALPASWTDLPERDPGEPVAVSATASLAGWRLLLERGERLRSRRPRRCRVSDENGGGDVGTARARGQRGGGPAATGPAARERWRFSGGCRCGWRGCWAAGLGRWRAMSDERKITEAHRRRRAVVYVRQSTALQVAGNVESAARQYALRDRAVALGWPLAAISVVDEDTGRSGSSTVGRLGFSSRRSAWDVWGWCCRWRRRGWRAPRPTGISCLSCAR